MKLLSYRQYLVKLFPANVPLMEKPGGWFLLAKCVKNTCGIETFHVKMGPASLLKMSLFHRYFSHSLLVQNNYLVSP